MGKDLKINSKTHRLPSLRTPATKSMVIGRMEAVQRRLSYEPQRRRRWQCGASPLQLELANGASPEAGMICQNALLLWIL